MLDYKILAKLSFRVILYTGIVEVLFTILLCYGLAVALGHKPMFLPTISECGEEAPEKYFFRWGILVGGILLAVEAVFLHNAKRISQLGYTFGVIAGVALTGVACVASNENLTIHLVFALSFFILEDLMVVLMLIENYHSLSYKSLAVKIPSSALACVATAARVLIMFGVLKVSIDFYTIVAIVEWINVGALIVYHMTLSDDLDDLYLAELEDDVARTTRKASLPETKPQTQSKDPLL